MSELFLTARTADKSRRERKRNTASAVMKTAIGESERSVTHKSGISCQDGGSGRIRDYGVIDVERIGEEEARVSARFK